MFRKARTSSTPTSPTSPGSGHEVHRNTPAQDEISDDYEVVQTPSGSNPNSIPSSEVHARPARFESRRHRSHPSSPTPGVTPPPHIRQASSRDDWYPSWLPRRPPPPAPASTVPSERGHANSPIPFMSSPSNAGTTSGGRPMASGAHRVTPSYDTGYTGYTGESGEYVDIGEYHGESEGTEERVGVGRRQTPRSVRIISEATAAAASSRRQTSSRHSRRPSSGVPQVRSRKEGRVGHVHGSGPRPWWRGTVSTPLSPTVVSPSPFPGGFAPVATDAPPPSAVPPHMRAYLPHPGMPGTHGFPAAGAVNLRPRFRAPGLDLGFLSTPSAWMRLKYILWPIWIYGLVVLQTFFDLNAVYCLVQLALHPTPSSPPSATSGDSNPSSSRNWALGAAAYGICWLFWVVGIVLLYEVVYCWWRRWRSKRPLMVPLYLSAPAYNIVCMTSFVNFCFFRHIRSSARPALPIPQFFRACGSSSSGSSIPSRAVTPSALSGATEARESQQREREVSSPITAEGKENIPIIPSTSMRNPVMQSMSSLSSWGDWFAETCFFYGQNLPTVALLLPRAALCVAILLAFSSAQPEDKALEALGLMKRDQTFFRADGSLSGYARDVLLANVAWAAWRVLILLISWIGLWWMSGQMCAGACGPRFRWEEPEEKPGYGRGVDEEQFEEAQGVLATWSWRECTRARVYDAYDLCLFLPPSSSRAAEKGRNISAQKSVQRVGGGMDEDEEDAVLDRVLAAAGLPTVPPPARRGALRGELFNTPPEMRRELSEEGDVQEIIISSPKPAVREGSSRSSRERSPASMKPYPFTTYPARQGSQDTGTPSQERIPFPPSPRTSKHSEREGTEHEAEEEEEEEDYDGEEDYDEFGLGVEEPSSSGRNSASMSSLGQQIPSRFPFQFRHVSRRSRGGRSSVGTQQSRSNSNKTSSASYGASHASRTASTSDRRRESQLSDSPWSQSQRSPDASAVQSPVSPRDVGTGSSGFGSPVSGGHLGSQSPIPMPPRAAHKERRQRASLPTLPVSALPAAYARVRDRSRTLSGGTQGSVGLNLSPHPQYESSGAEEEHDVDAAGEFGMLTDPEAEGSQEEAEREDSVGLLSGGPSPRSSLGMLRSRSNLSLTNLNLGVPHSRRSRHSSASSVSNSRSSRGSRSVSLSGSGSHGASARSRSVSAQARSRAQSLIQSIGAASRSNVSIEMGMRSRASSLARLSEVPSVHRRSGDSGAGSFSGASNAASPSQHRVNPEDYTFGQPIRLRVDSGSEGERRQAGQSPRERSPPSRRASRQGAPVPEVEAEPAQTVRESHSRASGLAPSEHSQQTMQQRAVLSAAPASSTLPIPTSGSRPLHGGPSFISSAHESFITRPTSHEGSSDTPGNTPSSYGTATYEPEHVHGHQGGGWQPA